MDKDRLLELFTDIKKGTTSPQEALKRFSVYPYEDLDFAKIDHHRSCRKGFPEVIFGQYKKDSEIIEIMSSVLKEENSVMATRISPETAISIKKAFPDLQYFADARIAAIQKKPIKKMSGLISIVSAGTADIPVAEEAAVTAELMGNKTIKHFDVGIAGIHRLFDHLEELRKARVIIVVAGMEGALPSVVTGLVSVPVIAVPTSVGYGASFEGVAPLLTMLNSCASGVAVVNIDNGFGAGYMAGLINKQSA